MGAYESFARVYDLFMDNVPYEEWGSYLTGLLREYGICSGTVAELGCGTGKMTRLLAAAGYDMIGVDNSEEMLEIAREAEYEADAWSAAEAWDEADETDEPEEYAELGEPDEPDELPNGGILYLLEDMRELELYGSVCAVVSVCDSMNYILEEEEVLGILTSAARNYLDYGGLFIFDLNTEYKYKEILGEQTIAENREESSFIWENYYDEDSHINEYNLTLFIKEHGDHYRKYEETHYQKSYSLDTIRKLAEMSGLELLHIYDAFTHEEPKADSERVYVVLRRPGQPE